MEHETRSKVAIMGPPFGCFWGRKDETNQFLIENVRLDLLKVIRVQTRFSFYLNISNEIEINKSIKSVIWTKRLLRSNRVSFIRNRASNVLPETTLQLCVHIQSWFAGQAGFPATPTDLDRTCKFWAQIYSKRVHSNPSTRYSTKCITLGVGWQGTALACRYILFYYMKSLYAGFGSESLQA